MSPAQSENSTTAPTPPIFYSRKLPAERSIAGIRVALVTLSLVAAWLYPIAPAEVRLLAECLLGAYALYSTGLLVLSWVAPAPLPYPSARRLIDVTVTFTLLYLSLGASSPFFPYVSCLLVIGVLSLAAASLLLPKLGTVVKRGGRDIPDLAGAPGMVADDKDVFICQLPIWAAQAVGAQRALIAWEQPEEPWLCLASFTGESARFSKEPPGVIEPLVAPKLSDANFFCRRADDDAHPVIYRSDGEFKRWHGVPLNPVIRKHFAPSSVLSVQIEGKSVRGRIFWFDKAGLNSDDVLLAEIVAREVSGWLDRFYSIRQLAEQAVEAERARMGRDLHDGALHALAGVALEIETVLRQRDLEFGDYRDRLQLIQRSLETEQRALRTVIDRLRRNGPTYPSSVGLSTRVKDLVERIERQRGLRVEWTGATALDGLSHGQANDVYLLLHEGLTNAARHSGANMLHMATAMRDGRLEIIVADNGRGFPLKGYYDLQALAALNLGPATLKERVTELGGELTVDSTDHGSRLQISLPAPDSVL
jgi:signal transduction histidine kinase